MSLASAELRQLVALDAVLRLRSFTRAAEDLGYTQSAVSQQIKNLERLVGATLVERGSGRNSVIPTDAGLRLQRHTQRVIASLQAAEADLAALAQGSDQLLLKVGTFQSVGATILPPLLTKLRDLAPEIEVELIEAVSTRELLEELANGQLDLSFALLPLERGPFEAATLMLDPFVLLVSSDSPIANHAQPATREELADLPLVGYRHPGTAPHAETRLLALGITPRIVFRTDELATVHGLVASGLAAAVLPCLAVNLQHDGVRTVDLHSLLPPRTVGLAWHADRDRSSAALIFQAQATRVCREITHVRAAAMHPLRGPTAA